MDPQMDTFLLEFLNYHHCGHVFLPILMNKGCFGFWDKGLNHNAQIDAEQSP